MRTALFLLCSILLLVRCGQGHTRQASSNKDSARAQVPETYGPAPHDNPAAHTSDTLYIYCKADTDGKPLNGNYNYLLHMDKDRVPQGSWSVTLYDTNGYIAANQLNIYSISNNTNLTLPADSSIDLYLEHNMPEPARRLNWMPIPKSGFNLLWRMWPKPKGEWKAPGVRKVE